MKLLTMSIFAAFLFISHAHGAQANRKVAQEVGGYSLNNYKVSKIEFLLKSNVAVTLDHTEQSLGKHGTLKLQLSGKDLNGPILSAILTAYSTDSYVDASISSKGEGLNPNENSPGAYFIIKKVAGPDGK